MRCRAIEQTTGAGCKCDGRCWLSGKKDCVFPWSWAHLNESLITNSYSKSVLLEVQGVRSMEQKPPEVVGAEMLLMGSLRDRQ